MSRRDELREEPYRFNFMAVLRELERAYPDKPRIGTNITVAEEIVRVGQDPFLEFPASNITKFSDEEGKIPDLRVRFMGFFGPQGALPIGTTEEILDWVNRRNPAFVHFADVFGGRFYQLFFRAWTSARSITQFDRPEDDRFRGYMSALAGLPVSAKEPVDHISPLGRLPVTGLLASRVRNVTRLQQIIETVLGIDVSIEENVPIWMEFEPDDVSQVGVAGSSLGMNVRLGSRVQSVNEKIRIVIRTDSMSDYKGFLPGCENFKILADLARGYLGPAIDVEIAPSLPSSELQGMQIGKAGALGQTGWVAPRPPDPDAQKEYVSDALFQVYGEEEIL